MRTPTLLVASDLDGTFLTSQKTVSARSLAALDALAQAGGQFVPCSGRPLYGISPELMAHPATRYAISSNGAVVSAIDSRDPAACAARVIHVTPLDKDKARAVLELTRGRDVTFDVFADGACYLRRGLFNRIDEFAQDPYVAQSMRENRTPVDEEPEETLARVKVLERVSVYWRDPADRDAVLAGLSEIPDIDVTRSYPMNIEIMDVHASKGAALTWLASELGVSREHTMGFGDNLNDISLIEAAGVGVAVANAEPEVRAAADALCASNDEDGPGRFILERLQKLA